MDHLVRARRALRPAATALVLALAVAACGSAATPAPTGGPSVAPTSAGPMSLNGTSWLLIDYTSPSGTNFTVPMAITPTLVFEADRATGNAGCNTFSASYTVTGNALKFGPATATQMACQEPIASVEKAYVATLAVVDTVTMKGPNLVMTQANGLAGLEFVPAAK